MLITCASGKGGIAKTACALATVHEIAATGCVSTLREAV